MSELDFKSAFIQCSFGHIQWVCESNIRPGSSLLLFSCSVLSDSLRPHELPHTRPPCPSLSPGVCSDWGLLSQWCHLTVILCCLLLLLSIFPSIRGVFSNESALHIRRPKYWSFSISPSNEYSGLISLRIDWYGLLVAQGTLKSLLQHHSSKASILRCSAFFLVQLSHPYMTAGSVFVKCQITIHPWSIDVVYELTLVS